MLVHIPYVHAESEVTSVLRSGPAMQLHRCLGMHPAAFFSVNKESMAVHPDDGNTAVQRHELKDMSCHP